MTSEAPATDTAPTEPAAEGAPAPDVNVLDDGMEGGSKSAGEAQSANNLFTKAASITRGVLNSAAESIQTSVKQAQASLRIPRKTDEAAGGLLEEGATVPTDVTSTTTAASVPTTDYDASAAGATATLPASHPAAPAAPAALAASLFEAADRLGRKTRESSSAAYQAAVQGIKRLTAPSRRVATVCKAELRAKPCPQTLLLCCNLIASKQGLATQGLFKLPAPRGPAEVERLADNLEGGSMLLPADLEPLAAAALVKHFLASLEDPLLTARMVDRWVSAGLHAEQGEAAGLRAAVQELPLANASALRLLIETCYRVASQSNVTGMNALGLATELAPVMLWREAGTQPPAATTAAATHAPQHASAQQHGSGAKPVSTFEALKARLGRGGSATSASGEGLPPIAPTSDSAPATTDSTSGGAAAAAATAAEDTGAGGGDADTAAAAAGPTTSRDLDDILSEGDHLEHVPEQATAAAATGTSGTATNDAAAAGNTAEGAAGAAPGNVSNKCVLQGKELEAVVRAVEYMILLFDDVFA